jgi:hypothetical protein
MPPTTGGSTIGKVVRPRSTALPRNRPRASSHASGKPNSTASTVLDSEAISESCSASSELLLVITLNMLPHGAPVTSPMSGNKKNGAASAARNASSGLNGCLDRSSIYDSGEMKPKLVSTS